MSEEWQNYVEDPRSICKYGEKCYQKNPDHHNKFKHPPKNSKLEAKAYRGAKKRFSPYSRAAKEQDLKTKVPHDAEKHDPQTDQPASSSDEDNNLVKPVEQMQSENEETAKEQDLNTEVPHDAQTKHLEDQPLSSSDENKIVKPVNQIQCENENKQTLVDDTFQEFINRLPKDVTYHSSTTDQDKYRECFLMEMPADFFKFYECLKEEKDLEKLLLNVNLQLIGPFDLLLGRLPVLDSKELYLVHWRFYYDPPEFQAVLKSKDKSEYHIGYYRDDPKAQPVFMAHTDSSNGCHITPYASNIFGAVYLYLENQKKSPFNAMTYKKMMDKVIAWAEKHSYSIEEYNSKRRTNLCIAKTLHGAGIMVPYDKKTQLGYRRLAESDATIKKLFKKLEEAQTQAEKDTVLSELQPVITYANIAVDECDFGTGLEVGIDMFCSGLKELEASALNSLCSVYSLLNRAEFGSIIQAHLKCRRKGSDMSILSIRSK